MTRSTRTSKRVLAFETPSDFQACRETRFRAIAVPRGYSAALVALAPISVGWLLAYALVALMRWIRGQVSSPRLDRGQVGYMPDKARLDVVTDRGGIADDSFDRDKFVAQLDGLSKCEIEARIRLGMWGVKRPGRLRNTSTSTHWRSRRRHKPIR